MSDVISQVKEAFLDENVDVEVLYTLKKMWEEKVNQSGAVDLNQKPLPPPSMRQAPRTSQSMPMRTMPSVRLSVD